MGVVVVLDGAVVDGVGQSVGALHEAVGLEHRHRHVRVAQHAVNVGPEKLFERGQRRTAEEERTGEPLSICTVKLNMNKNK